MSTSMGEAVAMKIIDGNPKAITLIALQVPEVLNVDVLHARSFVDLSILGGAKPVGEITVVSAWARTRGHS